jgi:hypothetical protein
MNPIGYEPRIRIKNNGTEALQSLRIDYGLSGTTPMTYTWKGRLDFGKSTEVVLPGTLESSEKQDLFTVTVSKPNNRKDEYPNDNRMTSVWTAPPVFPKSFIIVCKTNRDSSQTAWTLTNATGKAVYRKTEQELAVNTEYRDTVTLSHGHFQLLVTDSEGDGLEFWANPRGGMGSVKLVSLDGQLIRSYGSDFGNEIRQVFTVDKTKPVSPYQDALVMVYPHRPVQNTTLMLFFNQPQTVRAKLTTADGQVLQEMAWFEVRENNFQIDLSNYPDAIYMLELKYGDKTENIRLKKAGRR